MIDELDPPRERDLPPGRLEARRTELLAALGSRPEVRPPTSRRRRRRAVAVALVAAATLAAGAAVASSQLAHRDAGQLGDMVTCFAQPSTDAGSFGSPLQGQDLAAMCRQAWTSGALVSPPPGPAPARWVACAGDAGVDVFPSDDDDLCARLGLDPVPPSYFEVEARYAAMESDLWARIPEGSCLNGDAAAALARQTLDDHGYSGWTVTTSGFGPNSPCALPPDLDPVNGVVTVRAGVAVALGEAVDDGLRDASYCGPENVLLAAVRDRMSTAGFGDWTVRLDHALSDAWPCVVGWNADPGTKIIVITGHATR